MAIMIPGQNTSALGMPDLRENMMQLVNSYMVGQKKQEAQRQQQLLARLLAPQPQSGAIGPAGGQAPLISPEQQVQALLSHPELSQQNKGAGLRMLAAQKKIQEPYKGPGTEMVRVQWWDKKGQAASKLVKKANYNSFVDRVMAAGGRMDKPPKESAGPFGTGARGGAMNEMLRIKGKIDRGEEITVEDRNRWQLAKNEYETERVIGSEATGFKNIKSNAPAGWNLGSSPGGGVPPSATPVAGPGGSATGAPVAPAAGVLPPGGSGRTTVTQMTPPNRAPKAIPQEALKSTIATFDGLDFLNTMEANISKTGLFTGHYFKGLAFLGQDQGAIDFQTARRQFKLAAQSMIKGIPSNFDVEILIDTLPDMTAATEVNQSRIKTAQRMAKSLIYNTLSYYKGAGYTITDELIAKARAYGIEVDGVKPWAGRGDPLNRGPASGMDVQQRGDFLESQGVDPEDVVNQLIEEGYGVD